MMSVIICPGIHEQKLTEGFLKGLQWQPTNENPLIFPVRDYPAYSAIDILKFLCSNLIGPSPLALLEEGKIVWDLPSAKEVVFISFSAGVVGAIGAAVAWQLLGGRVKAFIALDGWGVPLWGNFSIHRMSHDRFTHWSSAMLGSGGDSFYADPPVEHLELWRSPQTVKGWWVRSASGRSESRSPTTAAQFITHLLQHYGD